VTEGTITLAGVALGADYEGCGGGRDFAAGGGVTAQLRLWGALLAESHGKAAGGLGSVKPWWGCEVAVA